MLTVSRTSAGGGDGEHPGGDVAAEALRHLDAALLERVGEDHGELVAAEAGHQVDLAQLGAELPRQLQQHPVADAMPVALVDGPEIVQVEHHQHEGVAETVGPLALVGQAVLEDPVAGDAGEGVDGGGVEQLGVGGGALAAQRDGEREQRGGDHQQDGLAHGHGAHLDARAEDQSHGQARQKGIEHQRRP